MHRWFVTDQGRRIAPASLALLHRDGAGTERGVRRSSGFPNARAPRRCERVPATFRNPAGGSLVSDAEAGSRWPRAQFRNHDGRRWPLPVLGSAAAPLLPGLAEVRVLARRRRPLWSEDGPHNRRSRCAPGPHTGPRSYPERAVRGRFHERSHHRTPAHRETADLQ